MSDSNPKYPDIFAGHIDRLIQRICRDNRGTLRALGPLIGRSVAKGGVIHTFGSGHSEILAREFVGRAGAPVGVSPVLDPTGGLVENLVGYGTRLAQRHHLLHGMDSGECIVVISNSGKNCAPIEVALLAREKGLTVIALTAMKMARKATSEHPNGMRLHEIADHVLDNGGEKGDACVPLGSQPVKAGPTPTIGGATLLNLLQLEVLQYLTD
jgi:uncharacterized phosphosugar-binding protein